MRPCCDYKTSRPQTRCLAWAAEPSCCGQTLDKNRTGARKASVLRRVLRCGAEGGTRTVTTTRSARTSNDSDTTDTPNPHKVGVGTNQVHLATPNVAGSGPCRRDSHRSSPAVLVQPDQAFASARTGSLAQQPALGIWHGRLASQA